MKNSSYSRTTKRLLVSTVYKRSTLGKLMGLKLLKLIKKLLRRNKLTLSKRKSTRKRKKRKKMKR